MLIKALSLGHLKAMHVLDDSRSCTGTAACRAGMSEWLPVLTSSVIKRLT